MQMEMQMKLPVSIGVLRAACGGGLDKKINRMICISSRPPSLPPVSCLAGSLHERVTPRLVPETLGVVYNSTASKSTLLGPC